MCFCEKQDWNSFFIAKVALGFKSVVCGTLCEALLPRRAADPVESRLNFYLI